MASTLYITITPADTLGARGWRFQVDGTNQVGILPGSLRDAGTSALCLALGAGRAAVVVALPRAGRFWWQSRRVVLRGFDDVDQLRDVDLVALRERWARAERWRKRFERVRTRLGWCGLPRVWPSVP